MPSSFTSMAWIVPHYLRGALSKPLGPVLDTESYLSAAGKCVQRGNYFITVGDVVSRFALERGLRPKLAIIDGKTKRNVKFAIENLIREADMPVLETSNPAGSITFQAFCDVRRSLESLDNGVLFVDGEEDLLALPAVVLSPYGTWVFYGQPNEGVVAVKVDKPKKELAAQLFSKLEVRALEHTRRTSDRRKKLTRS